MFIPWIMYMIIFIIIATTDKTKNLKELIGGRQLGWLSTSNNNHKCINHLYEPCSITQT